MRYTNPIIPGFHPDPSFCRVGRDFYLVTSSFEDFPGVPLFHSRDLAHWEQLGYVLTRDSQLPLEKAPNPGGIYAPTIRWHDGVFYMTTTNVTHGGNFIVHTRDIHGEWSEPAWVAQSGIDPSLFFDDDGKVYFTSTQSDETGRQGTGMCVVDPMTGEKLTPTRIVWYGNGGRYPEAPHLFKRFGKYYLMLAEGGTEYGHMVTIARSDSPWGPYESCPRNPILTHRELPNPEIAGTGHADLEDDEEGRTWLVCLGYRMSEQYFHHLGRETFLAPVEWDEDGWPVVNGGKPLETQMEAELPEACPVEALPEKDWLMNRSVVWRQLRNPIPENYSFGPEGLTLRGTADGLDSLGYPTALLQPQTQFDMYCETEVSPRELPEGAKVGLTLYYNPTNHFDLVLENRGGQNRVVFTKYFGDIVHVCDEFPWDGSVTFGVEADRKTYTFYVGGENDTRRKKIGTGFTYMLSTEAAPCSFNGVMLGLFAVGGTAVFRYFTHRKGS